MPEEIEIGARRAGIFLGVFFLVALGAGAFPTKVAPRAGAWIETRASCLSCCNVSPT